MGALKFRKSILWSLPKHIECYVARPTFRNIWFIGGYEIYCGKYLGKCIARIARIFRF